MAWISPASGRWTKRLAVTVDFLSGSSPNDVNIVLDNLGDEFWGVVDSSGNEIRVTQANGVTGVPFDLDGWNYTNKTGTLECDNVAFTATDSLAQLFIYYGHTGSPSSVSTSVTPSSPKTGHAVPPKLQNGSPVILVQPQRRGATKPRETVVKGSGETIFIWFDFSRVMGRFRKLHNSSTLCEELDYAQLDVLRSDADQAAMKTEADTRFFHPHLVRVTVKAGSTGTDYTVSLTVGTTEGRVLNARCLLKVQNVDET